MRDPEQAVAPWIIRIESKTADPEIALQPALLDIPEGEFMACFIKQLLEGHPRPVQFCL